jgi:hypothetical protein
LIRAADARRGRPDHLRVVTTFGHSGARGARAANLRWAARAGLVRVPDPLVSPVLNARHKPPSTEDKASTKVLANARKPGLVGSVGRVGVGERAALLHIRFAELRKIVIPLQHRHGHRGWVRGSTIKVVPINDVVDHSWRKIGGRGARDVGRIAV